MNTRQMMIQQAAERLAIKKAERLDARRTAGHSGHAPDSDEDTGSDSGDDYLKSSGFNFTAEGGFWKYSEYLKTKAGLRMNSDERGLPPGYAQGPTWRRAEREAAAVRRI